MGALLVAALPTQGILLIDVGTALLAIVPLFFFSIPQPAPQDEEQSQTKLGLLNDVRDGLTYIRSIPGFTTIIFIALFLNFLLVPTTALLPLLVTRHFEKGALELGLLESALGVGMIIGGILLSVWGGFRKKIVTSLFGIIGLGAGVMLLGIAPAHLFLLAVAGNTILGLTVPIANGPIFALLQSIVRANMRRRVTSLLTTGATAISPLGLLIAGPFSDWLGIRVWFVAGGMLSILIALLAFLNPVIMNVETQKEGSATPISTTA